MKVKVIMRVGAIEYRGELYKKDAVFDMVKAEAQKQIKAGNVVEVDDSDTPEEKNEKKEDSNKSKTDTDSED